MVLCESIAPFFYAFKKGMIVKWKIFRITLAYYALRMYNYASVVYVYTFIHSIT